MKRLVLAVTAMLVVNACWAGEGKPATDNVEKKTTEAVWLTDFEKASKLAAAEGKHMLLDFSGSDWCGWCIKLDNEVFSKAAFKQYAEENLVLVMLDFPRANSQSDKLKAQNKVLAEKYGVTGFPTVLILDSTGKSIAKTGYQAGGPDAYVKHIKSLIKK